MAKSVAIIDDPNAYGSKGQSWNSDFVAYMVEIVNHPVYAGMPDAVTDGKIQWEAPSNRGRGRHQHTHHRRRIWWREKALSIGVDPTSNKWISVVAKQIHPTGEKPCKRCGRVMQIAYVYPNGHLRSRAAKMFGDDIEDVIDSLIPITEIVQSFADRFGTQELVTFGKLLRTRSITPPEGLDDIDSWISWIEEWYIPGEPSLLSPGSMSNAPDRFDGFHSFNLCCRKKADTGRNDTNMRSYTTDRRVFEYWSDGDWIAADRMMGMISASMRDEPCADGGSGPPTADHIGPISLGFVHRPQFRLLSRSANSAKNNRLTTLDVEDLLVAEDAGSEVVSWYAKPLWALRCREVGTDELCLRLSKMLRDNQRVAMHMFGEVYRARFLTFLAAHLGLDRANYNVEFENLRVENFMPTFDAVVHSARHTKYADEQKARRLRIGFEALQKYGLKGNRHASFIPDVMTGRVTRRMSAALSSLEQGRAIFGDLDVTIEGALSESDVKVGEQKLRELARGVPQLEEVPHFLAAQRQLIRMMSEVATVLSGMWEADRYVRGIFEEVDND